AATASACVPARTPAPPGRSAAPIGCAPAPSSEPRTNEIHLFFLLCLVGGRIGELCQFRLVREGKRLRIDAVALSGRLGTVVEDMAKMAAATGTQNLRADHAVAAIDVREHVLRRDRLKEAGP